MSQAVGNDAPATAEDLLAGRKRTVAERIQHILHGNPALSPAVVLVLAVIVFAIASPGFMRPQALSLLVQQTAVVGALAVGQTVVILTAGIDLSIGLAMVLSSLVMVKLVFDESTPGVLALLIGTIVALADRRIQRVAGDPIEPAAVHRHLGQPRHLHRDLPALRPGPDDRARSGLLLLWTGKSFSLGSFSVTWGVVLMLVLYARRWLRPPLHGLGTTSVRNRR